MTTAYRTPLPIHPPEIYVVFPLASSWLRRLRCVLAGRVEPNHLVRYTPACRLAAIRTFDGSAWSDIHMHCFGCRRSEP